MSVVFVAASFVELGVKWRSPEFHGVQLQNEGRCFTVRIEQAKFHIALTDVHRRIAIGKIRPFHELVKCIFVLFYYH